MSDESNNPIKPMVFDYGELNVRVIDDAGGVPWFVAKDVCTVLEHTDARKSVAGLDDDEKELKRVPTPGGLQELWTVNESGLYTLILRSNKPKAKPFRKWITSEVLPALRKTGRYEMPGRQAIEPEMDTPLTGRIEVVNMIGYTIHIKNGRPMIQDKELARHIGYQAPKRLRGMIDSLIIAGRIDPEEVMVETAMPAGLIGGRPYRCYYLNERGAVKFAAHSRLPGAGAVANDLADVFELLRDTDMTLPNPAFQERQGSDPLAYTYGKAADMLTGFVKAGETLGVPMEENRSRALHEVERITGVDFSRLLEKSEDALDDEAA